MLLVASFAAIAAGLPAPARAQAVTGRGFVELRGLLFPQETDPDGRQAFADLLARYEVTARPASWLTLSAGIDARADTWDQTEERLAVSINDRDARRPALALRRLSFVAARGALTVEAGKQFVRWGKTDLLVPTDRFAPRDYLEVVATDLLPVAAVRATYERAGRTLDLVWVPHFTPSRLPLAGSRWSPQPPAIGIVAVVDGGAEIPAGPQVGARFSQVASGFEYSVSAFDGYHHLPQVESRLRPGPLAIEAVRVYPRIRAFGGDLAWPNRWFTLKAEASFFDSSDRRADRYWLYVVQIERQSGEWFFVGGYAGEAVVTARAEAAFAPDRGLTRAFLGRASYTLDTNRSIAAEGAIRQNGRGTWIKAEYSQAFGSHWRVTVAGHLVRGREDDFLGQFRLNSHADVSARYSF